MFKWLRKLLGIQTYAEEYAEIRAKANEEIKALDVIHKKHAEQKKQKNKTKIKQARALVKKKKLKRVYRTLDDGSKAPCYVDNTGEIVTYGLLAYLLLNNDNSPSLEQNYNDYMDNSQDNDSSYDSDSHSSDSYDSSDDGGDSGGDSGD
jgi:predicted Zn-dependent protease